MPTSVNDARAAWWQRIGGSVTGRELAVLLMVGLAMAPVEYICHESGHALAAILVGGHPMVHSGFTSLAAGDLLNEQQYFIFTLGGPLVDWLVGLTGTLLLTMRYTPLRLGLASWVARPLQYAPAWLGINLPQFGLSADTGNADETKLNAYLGWPPHTVLWLETVAAAIVLAWIIFRVPAAKRIPILASFSAGVLLGWAAWIEVGPYILPLATATVFRPLNSEGVTSFCRYLISSARSCAKPLPTRRCGTSFAACWRTTSRAKRQRFAANCSTSGCAPAHACSMSAAAPAN